MRNGVSGCGGGDYFTSHLKLNNSRHSESSEWAAFGRELLGSLFDVAITAGVACLAGTSGPSKKGMQKAMSGDAFQHKQDLCQKTTEFSKNYPNAKFSSDGKVVSAFSDLTKDFDSIISVNDKKLKDANGQLKTSVTQYNSEKAINTALSSSIETYKTNISLMDSARSGNISAGDVSMAVTEACIIPSNDEAVRGQLATVNEGAIKTKFPITDPKTKDANQLRADKMMQAAQQQCNNFNQKAQSCERLLTQHKVNSFKDLQAKKQASDDELKRLGEIEVATGETVKSVTDAIDAAKSSKAELGSKSDYDVAVKEINDLVDQVAEDEKLAKLQADADKSKLAYKNAKKHGASKADRKFLKQQRNADRNNYTAELYKQFNSRTT